MKRFLTFAILVFAVVSLSAQGSYLTRQIKRSFDDLEQPAFAALEFADSSVTQALTADTWSVISEFSVAGSNDCTGSDDTITITKAGGYEITATLSYDAADADTINVQIYKNGTGIGPKTLSETAEDQNVALKTYESLSQGDYVTLRMVNIVDGGDAVIKSGSLFVRRIYY